MANLHVDKSALKKIIHDDSTKCEEKILEFQALKQAEKCTETAESRV